MNDTVEWVVDLVLTEGLDDWVSLTVLRSHCVEAAGSSGEEADALVFSSVKKLVEEGLARPGHLADTGFEAWDLTAEETVERLREDLTRLGWGADLGYSCWFSNTALGDGVARRNREERRGA